MWLARLEGQAQRFALAQQVRLANDLVQVTRPQCFGQGRHGFCEEKVGHQKIPGRTPHTARAMKGCRGPKHTETSGQQAAAVAGHRWRNRGPDARKSPARQTPPGKPLLSCDAS
ncbi:hypothetical protein GCM10023090_25900 [Acidovorax lacteus]|uniref:Uncharacterized protein n=1 Tax=Acidovorax lacteus TaxID=1924988 RepID=A0ABP8LEN2_9BURK